MRRANKYFSTVLISLFAVFAAACSLFSSDAEVLIQQHGRFVISITCEPASYSYTQYLRVAIGGREIYKTFTRDFDTFHDCSSSLSNLEVEEESVILLPFYDKTEIYFVESMLDY